mmetsp:Transcript_11356/g.24938  ORF Transcript_11356/g.24938 Transcript_11356/m.24938 type:complete len:87 (+) Transcript_11356:1045-1305(+)
MCFCNYEKIHQQEEAPINKFDPATLGGALQIPVRGQGLANFVMMAKNNAVTFKSNLINYVCATSKGHLNRKSIHIMMFQRTHGITK